MTHDELVTIGSNWLKSKFPIVITEVVSSHMETPDVLGISPTGSMLIECKTSVADFKRDSKKFFRRKTEYGLGEQRYFLTPHGLLKPEAIPVGWGLLEYDNGRIRKIKDSDKHFRNEHSYRGERTILISLVRRIGQQVPNGISVRCYLHNTKSHATLSVDNSEEEIKDE